MMMLAILKRCNSFATVRINPHAFKYLTTFRTFSSMSLNGEDQSPLSSSEIKVVDSDTWELSSGLTHLSKTFCYGHQMSSLCREEFGYEANANGGFEVKGELDFDEIEDMRVHGNLFYKTDRDSKEFEEYKFEFHRRKPRSSNNTDKETEKKERVQQDIVSVNEQVSRIIEDKYIVCVSHDNAKKQRKPTFNQLTGPYHEPFCLDVFVSKQSVRACVVHRVTSKVVAVAHSISKDMKFDLGSTRNANACAAVGKVLAQRALADDIHDLIFTPRKGDKLEGKLQIVLQSIINNGVNVKIKLKQRNAKKAIVHHMP